MARRFFRRRRFRRRRFTSGRFGRGRKATSNRALSIALKALKLARGDAHNKVFNYSGTQNTTATYNCITAVSQGVNVENRAGNSISVYSIFFRGIWTSAQPALGTDLPIFTKIRMMIFIDKCPTGADPTDVLLFHGGSASFTAVLNDDYAGERFVILFNRFVTLSSNFHPFATFEYYHRFKKPLEVKYRATGATITDIATGAIHTRLVSDRTTFLPTIEGNARIYFHP